MLYVLFFILVARHVQLFVTPWTVARQALLSMGFSRQEYWSGLPFPSPGDLTDPGIEPRSPALQADSLLSEPPGKSSIYVLTNFFLHALPLASISLFSCWNHPDFFFVSPLHNLLFLQISITTEGLLAASTLFTSIMSSHASATNKSQ